jgi:hypothetical protein
VLSFRRLAPVAAVALLAAMVTPGHAADRPGTVSTKSPVAHWHGTLDGPAQLGCGQPNLGCDVTDLVIDAPKGSWVTVGVDDLQANVRVTTGGRLVGSGGQDLEANPDATQHPTTTFQHVAAGRVTYSVAVGDMAANPVGPISFTGTAQLAGNGFDRAGDCGVTPGTEHLNDSNDGKTRPVAVRLVADPKDAATVRQAGKTIVEIYARIGVPIRVSYDFRTLPPYGTGVPYEGVRAAYGGVRPRGVDVVHVMTDDYAGGVADCIGGVAYPEKAFSVGNVHYTVQGTAPVSQVPAGMVAAHEIGHLLGGQHQQSNCAEAAPQEAAQPASDGWTGPCTIMGPAALQDSETFSTLERGTIRYFATRYAGKA